MPSPLTHTGVCAGLPSARKVTRSTNAGGELPGDDVGGFHGRLSHASTRRGARPRPRLTPMSGPNASGERTRRGGPARAPPPTRRRPSSAPSSASWPGLIFFKVIPQIGSYEDAWTAIQAMNAFDIAVIVACVLVYNVVYGFPFMAAVPGLERYPRLFQLNQGAFAISNGIPRRCVRPRCAVRDARVVPGAAHRRDGCDRRDRRGSIFVTLGLPVFGLMAIAASGTISAGSTSTSARSASACCSR